MSLPLHIEKTMKFNEILWISLNFVESNVPVCVLVKRHLFWGAFLDHFRDHFWGHFRDHFWDRFEVGSGAETSE